MGARERSARSLRVLHTEWSTGWGGQERRTLRESIGFRERRCEVRFACQPGSELLAKAAEAGFECAAVRMRGAADVAAMIRLRKLIAKWRPDVVATHSSVDTYLASVAARLVRRRPLIVRTRHLAVPPKRAFAYGLLPDAVVTVSEHVREDLVRRLNVPAAKVFAIPTGIDTESFSPRPPSQAMAGRIDVAAGAEVVLMVSVFRYKKGHHVLVEAAPRILERVPEAVFVLAGEGSMRERNMERVRELGCEERFRFPGLIEDVPELISLARVCVMPSFKEALGTFAIEALAMKKPVVATRVGGIPEVVVDGETGLLVEARDPAELARAIVRVLEDRELAEKLGERGRKLAVEKYSLGLMQERMFELYSRLAVSRRGK